MKTPVLDTFVSVVLIADQYTEGIESRIVAAANLLKGHYVNYEVVVIDNGLSLDSLSSIKGLLPKVACIRVVRLAKLDDTDTAIFAGLEAAIGDYVITAYNNDPLELIPELVELNREKDIVFGIATNLSRATWFEQLGARLFYWYNKKYLNINIPKNATYYIAMNRGVVNALTRNNRSIRHIRHLARMVGFESVDYKYALPPKTIYSHAKLRDLILKALDILSGYSNHPLRALSYFGVFAAVLNLCYAAYVVTVNVSLRNVEKGWTTLSLQASIMFFLLFVIMAVLSEYLGKILIETRGEPTYHIMQELSSTVSVADETRLNVTK
jgi:glycosyltransferase involved in cell wall biosynthesis